MGKYCFQYSFFVCELKNKILSFCGCILILLCSCSYQIVDIEGQSTIVAGTIYSTQSAQASTPIPAIRPNTGLIKSNTQNLGAGTLEISNNSSKDLLIILISDEKYKIVVYIRSREIFIINGISEGIYSLYYSMGSNWTGKEFLESPSYQRSDSSFLIMNDSTWRFSISDSPGGFSKAITIPSYVFPSIDD